MSAKTRINRPTYATPSNPRGKLTFTATFWRWISMPDGTSRFVKGAKGLTFRK